MSTPSAINPKRFEPICPANCDVAGRHWHETEFETWKASLTADELQRLKDKAAWEGMSLSAVAMEWGV